MEKITIKEFFDMYDDYNDVFGIHCKTKKEAKMLLKAFDKAGYKWRDGEHYNDNNTCFSLYKENTTYFNVRQYGDLNYAKASGIKVYEFDEVDLEG